MPRGFTSAEIAQLAFALCSLVLLLALIGYIIRLFFQAMRKHSEGMLIANDTLEIARESHKLNKQLTDILRRQIELQSEANKRMQELTESLRGRTG